MTKSNNLLFIQMSLPTFAPLSLPSWGGGASASVFTQLLRGDLPDPLAIIRAYRPRSLNPLDEVPAKCMYRVVIEVVHL